ncbi:PD-(D/E)XK nuclease family protein [Bacillus sp. ISL-41]|uniref:PD-(D/E)XK nuclease family protein n=1 Tax=Bacillus sp. ISL-41 TaxID=2819127 RepID=UPI001BE5EE18|nr:PD-(D/E)XK nuclease family protein [Bacillus sp. ISL-41]MBT2644637.1 PD-(D/E)XK nuclease family protein [Bacillus sp. ISL-41]
MRMNGYTCPRCGANVIEKVWEKNSETEDGGIKVVVHPVYMCSDQKCGYMKRVEPVPEIKYQQDGERLLLIYPDEQGRIVDLKDRVIWPPVHYLSILGRGYWEEYTGNHDVETLLENARDSESYGIEQPNLFNYATSELSQDAFLCWLIAWSHEVYRSNNKPLHQAALDFISMIFNVHEEPVPVIKNITIEKQYEGLDVLAIVNDQYAILIEDKTFTKDHSNQLIRYSEAVARRNPEWIQLPIYYKIADQSNYHSVTAAHYFPLTRKHMLPILRRGRENGVNHDVFLDYLSRLEWLDRKYEAFRTIPVRDWDDFAWQGFYMELQKEFDGNWGYVSNRRGGFWGFWWKSLSDRSYYLQLEENKLCVKLEAEEGMDLSRVRKVMGAVLLESELKGLQVQKPSRLRAGKTMTIAQRKDYIQATEEGLIDIKKTIDELKKWNQDS